MSRGADWFSFHATIDPIDTASALRLALDDPEQRWYAKRRVNALAATGALRAAGWNPNVHPRGRDGKFIEKFGWVRWFEPDIGEWRTGWVSDIRADDGRITVRSGDEKVEFDGGKFLYARPKPKARLDLPDPTDSSKLPDKFTKIGGQGGSNPGALYQIDGSFADDPPDISNQSKMLTTFSSLKQVGGYIHLADEFNPDDVPETVVPDGLDLVMVPRIDGTLNRYEVLQRVGSKWYRIPNRGQVSGADDGGMRAELEVSAADAFGQPGTDRRNRVISDKGTIAITRAAAFDEEDAADMVQQTASQLPGVGAKYYVKKMNIPERARSEALANDLYELLGIPVPEVAVGSDGSTISSKIVLGTIPFDPLKPEHVKAAQKGFIADAWLANWDVIGQSYDNIQVDADGNVWRIDAGGSLEYRAKGTPKGANFGDTVNEITSFKNPSLNPTAGSVFGSISNGDMLEQAKVLQSITPAEIQYQADLNNMSHVGPVLIARRKNILDQLGIQDPPAPVEQADYGVTPSTPQTVYNPVESVQQVGTPPTVAVHNWTLSYDDLPAEVVYDEDWNQPGFINDKVWKHDGDLWVYDSELEEQNFPDAHVALWRNLFTGDIKRFTVWDKEDEFLVEYDTDNVDPLIDVALPSRDLAVAEIVARTAGIPVHQLESDIVNKDGDPPNMRYGYQGIGNWSTLEQAWSRGRLGRPGPEGSTDRPLMGADGDLWEITAFGPDGIKLRRRDDGSNVEAVLTPDSFNATGPWDMPANDTTAEVWKSKFQPVPDEGAVNLPDGTPLHVGDQVVYLNGDEAFTVNALEPDPENPGGGLAELDDGSGMPSASKGWYNVEYLAKPSKDDLTGEFGADGGLNIPGEDDGISDAYTDADTPAYTSTLSDADVKAVEDANAEWMTESAPTASKKIVHGVDAAFSPGEPTLSTEMAVSDFEAIKAEFMGKNVIVLPIESYGDQSWDGYDLGNSNGLGTVTEVITQDKYDYTTHAYTPGAVKLKVSKPYGGFSWVISGDDVTYKKVIIPVETEPKAQPVVFKKNGDIFINGTKVGTYSKDYGKYYGIIDGDHSVTGEPLHFSAYSQKDTKNAASSLVVPIAPPPPKPKSAKVLATEAKVKDLQAKIEELDTGIAALQDELAKVPDTGVVAGPGNPLNDGSKPVKGDWVFSTKDGTWAQVLNPNVVGFAGKGVLSPDMIKVKIQDPSTGKWKQSNRKRETLVSAAGPGQVPFVMKTKAIKDAGGDWIGPGIAVYFGASTSWTGSNVLVLDTTPGGSAKVAMPDGSQQWVNASSYLAIPVAENAPTLKVSGANPEAEYLNKAFATLNDEKAIAVSTLAATLAKPTPKPKKPFGTPYPGPGGMTVKQPAWLAEERTAKGLKNMKDGYVPAPGMILRHNDGTQYIVYNGPGDEWSSHKNSVRVAPVSDPSDYKWRALTTMVVDHEAMLTDINGDPLPIISEIEGGDWAPVQGIVLSKPFTTTQYYTDAGTGKSKSRPKTWNRYFIVGYDGSIYNIDGSKAPWTALQPAWNSVSPPTRIGYLDTTHPGGKKLTLSNQPNPGGAAPYKIQYAVIHDPNTPAAIPLAQEAKTPAPTALGFKPVPPANPKAPSSYTPPPAPTPTSFTVGDTVSYQGQSGEVTNISGDSTVAFFKPPGADGDWVSTSELKSAAPAPTPAPPPTPTAAPIPTTTVDTPLTDDLPVFTGTNPAGQEVPHPPTTTSAGSIPVFQPTPGEPTLDVVNVPGAQSVTQAIDRSLNVTEANIVNGEKKWVGTYGLADGDTIEDMMVRSQTVRDASGTEYIEVSFRLDIPAARTAHNTFMTSSKNEMGDWQSINRNATNLVPGDRIAVRTAAGGAATPAGALRPDDKGTMPNATVVAAPVLIGKNKQYAQTPAGTYDVYRTQVMTASGDIGFIDVEDRNHTDSLTIFEWDPTLARATTSAKGLNTNAQNDGWSVKTNQLSWSKSTQWQQSDIGPDGAKTLGTNPTTMTPGPGGGTKESESLGTGSVIQRDYQGAHIEYATSPKKNALDGHTVIRVRADDPDAQRKISEAMELVGVTREKQKPPDKDALIKMATDKVFEQFNPNYTRGKTPNSPQEALDAIDNAVGAYMPKGPDGKPRKATLDDISIRIAKDGLVQVLVSEDVSRAIIAKNGVKGYVHKFKGEKKLEMIEQIMAGESPSLLSTTERFQHGLWFTGMSSGADHGYDSADHLFFYMDKDGNGGSYGSATADAVTMHRHLDYYYYPGDSFGDRKSEQLNWLNNPSGGGELMVQRRFEAELFAYIMLSQTDKDTVIKHLHKRGIYNAPNGKPLEEFLVTQKPPTLPVDFGDEIVLTALPDIVPALAGV